MANVIIDILTKYKGKGFKQFQDDADKSAKSIKETFTKISTAIAAAGIFREVSEFRREAIELSKIQEQAEGQLAARLESTGHAAGLTADELKNLASELQGVTNIGDEATIAAEAMLLSFTNIGGETFPRTTRAILDVATAMSNGATPSAEQLRNTAIQLGKALNDPEQGLAALTRVGVSFTEQQKEQIKTLTEAGKIAEAQALILSELEKEFGGSAEAARDADGGAIALSNSIGDLKEQIGGLLQPTITQNEALIAMVDALTGLTTKTREYFDLGNQLIEMQNENASTSKKVLDGYIQYIPIVGQLNTFIQPLVANEEQLAEAEQQLAEEAVDAGQAVDDLNASLDESKEKSEEAAKALEESAKRMEQVSEIRRDAARELIDIDEQAQEDIDEAWQDFFEGNAQAWERYTDNVKDIRARGADDLERIDTDLQKNLEKNAADLQKNLAKTNKDENKQIEEIKRRAATEEKTQSKRRQIDALADERLFNFELKQLAAEGNANAIKEALERREIEEQIAKEKAQVESQIEDEKLQQDIQRVRDTAQERRSELQTEAAERASILRQEADEARALREEQLAEELEAEKAKLAEEHTAREEALAEKIALINEGKEKAIATLAEELAETGDLTRSELAKLVPVAGEFGDAAGTAFAEGLNKGFEENERISGLLGEAADFRAPSRAGAGGSRGLRGGGRAGFGANPGALGFQHGGSFTVGGSGGPDSQLVQFMATPGERVDISPQGRGGGGVNFSPTININGPVADTVGAEQLVKMMNQWGQEFVDTVLVPTLEGV